MIRCSYLGSYLAAMRRHTQPERLLVLGLLVVSAWAQMLTFENASGQARSSKIEANSGTSNSRDEQAYVPPTLLKLMHSPEVHRELQLTGEQVANLEALFSEIDGQWFRSRNFPPDKQRATVRQLDEQLWKWLNQNLASDRIVRVTQLVYRSQGMRMLFDRAVQQEVGLDAKQIQSLRSAADAVQAAEGTLNEAMKAGGKTDLSQKALAAAIIRENKLPQTLLSDIQKTKVANLLGKEFDTQSLTRIFPMAPELVPVANWINSQPLTLESLRGKVVLLHFYAFQCHNCHANFDKYIRWHETYKDKGVVVLGIQTPETDAESDPEKVLAAANEKGLLFPILVDLGNKNWDNWSNTMWPTVYVIDQQGYLRHWWQGELNWQGAKGDEVIEKLVGDLIK